MLEKERNSARRRKFDQHNNLETVRDKIIMMYVGIVQEVAYGFSIGTEIGDLE